MSRNKNYKIWYSKMIKKKIKKIIRLKKQK